MRTAQRCDAASRLLEDADHLVNALAAHGAVAELRSALTAAHTVPTRSEDERGALFGKADDAKRALIGLAGVR